MDSVARIFRALGTRVEPAVPVRVESTRNRVLSNRDIENRQARQRKARKRIKRRTVYA